MKPFNITRSNNTILHNEWNNKYQPCIMMSLHDTRFALLAALIRGHHRSSVYSPHKGPVRRNAHVFFVCLFLPEQSVEQTAESLVVTMIRSDYALTIAIDLWCVICEYWTGIILCMFSANERQLYTVTSSLIGWAHTQNDPLLKGHFSHPYKHPFWYYCSSPVGPMWSLYLSSCSVHNTFLIYLVVLLICPNAILCVVWNSML